MKSLAALDRPSWLSSSAWPWQPYLLSHHQGGIAVTDIGDGPAVLFVHVGSWSFVWRDVLLRLANDFRCVAIDAPGCGLSDRLSTPPTLAQAADAITSVIDALQLRDLTLVAHDPCRRWSADRRRTPRWFRTDAASRRRCRADRRQSDEYCGARRRPGLRSGSAAGPLGCHAARRPHDPAGRRTRRSRSGGPRRRRCFLPISDGQ